MRYRIFRWSGVVTAFAISVIMLVYELIAGAGPVSDRIILIPVICFLIAGIVFLIFRRPWK